MNTCLRSSCRCIVCSTLPALFVLGATAAIFHDPGQVQAQTLAYSFEFDADGFGPNGGGVTVEHDTIGATDGSGSLKVSVVSGATFVGALTSVIDPEIIGDPPGVDYVLFDLTITEEFAPEPLAGFAVVGVSVFGASQPDYPGGQQFGLHVQFTHEEHIDGLAAGTYTDMRIDLAAAHFHPLTFDTGGSFNEIFGDGPDDLIPTGFQFFFNKTGSQSDHPLTVYIDNVRIGMAAAGIPGDFNGNGAVENADLTLLLNNWGAAVPPVPDGWVGIPQPTEPAIDNDELTALLNNWGNTDSGSGSLGVPEPGSAILLILAGACGCGVKRRRPAW